MTRLLLSASGGAVAIGFSAVFFQLAQVSAATGAFFRCALALPFLWLLREREGGGERHLRRWLPLLAGVVFAGDLLAWHTAILKSGAGLGTVLGHTQILFVTLIAAVRLRERLSARVLGGIAIVLTGVAVVAGLVESAPYGHDPAGGAAYGLLAGFLYALFILLLRASNPTPGVSAAALFKATSVTAGVLLIHGAVTGEVDFAPAVAALAWLAALALCSQVIGWMMISRAIGKLPAVTTSFVLTLQPAAALAGAAVVLAERPSVLQLVGVGLLVSGIFVAISPARGRQPEVAGTPRTKAENSSPSSWLERKPPRHGLRNDGLGFEPHLAERDGSLHQTRPEANDPDQCSLVACDERERR